MFWPCTVWINCSSDLKHFVSSRPSASNFSFSRSLELFLAVRQNNFYNKICWTPVLDREISCTNFQLTKKKRVWQSVFNFSTSTVLFVFPRIVSAETILFWIWPYVLWPLLTVHKSAETNCGNTLFVIFGQNSVFPFRWNERIIILSFFQEKVFSYILIFYTCN